MEKLVNENGVVVDPQKGIYTMNIVTQLTGLAQQTLRKYERCGLIKPDRVHRYRMYSQDDISRILKIKELSAQGVNIAGIKIILCKAYFRWDITTLDNGHAHVRMETNDNNEDGYADSCPLTITERDVSLDRALSVAGKSRTGRCGQPVDVYIDGKKV